MQYNSRKINKFSQGILFASLLIMIIFPTFSSEYNSSIVSLTKMPDISINYETSISNDTVLNLVIIWHQHQPSYQDPETGIYEQPWVFMHGSNSYPYMADVLNDYPDINVTINLTPSMLKQLVDYINGTAFDRRIELARMDESAMSDENKSVVIQYFFDINGQFRQNGTRYFELSEKRNSYNTLQEAVEGFTDQDFLDLKTLFFAHWINPRYTTEQPYQPPVNPFGYTLKVLTDDANGVGGYNSAMKNGVLDYAYSIVEQVISLHKQLQNEGRLEIITTPFYHPILPLLINLTNAREVNEGVADLPLPDQNTLWTEDALAQIQKGKNYTASLFGKYPVGMWPSEEAVSDEIIPLVNQSGIEWFVTDYTVLQNSLGVSQLTPEQWFQPYVVKKDGYSSVVFFRHQQLSDEIGFNYGGLDPEVAATNMLEMLKTYRDSWTDDKDPVFTVALDGENAWENYQYDLDGDGRVEYTGNLFREYMYQKLEEAQDEGWLRTITPKQYLAEHPPSTLQEIQLATGSWAGDLNTWIGEDDENEAWDRLITTRQDLIQYMTDHSLSKDDLPDAWEALYAAEGSDWFWWYGSDQDSGHDELFDWQFKTILRGVYKSINWTESEIMENYPYLYLKMLPPVSASIQGKYLPTIDGFETNSNEWTLAAHYSNANASDPTRLFKDLYLGVDEALTDLHIRLDTTDAYSLSSITGYSVGLYFSNPNAQYSTIFPRFADSSDPSEILGFEITTEIRIDLETGDVSVFEVNSSYKWDEVSPTPSISLAIDDFCEMSIPFSLLGIEKGDLLYLRVLATNESSMHNFDITPEDGPWSLNIPFGGVNMVEVFAMDDPAYDEHGIYPTNPQMHPDYDVNRTGLMDILRFRVGYIDDTVYFEFKFRELFNPWNGPGGYSHPLMQVYIDEDNVPGSGRTDCDQNGHFNISSEHAWEYMVRADGWLQYILLEDDTQVSGVSTFSDSVDKVIVFSAPASVIGLPQTDWAYTVVVGSQDFQKFREFYAQPQEWKFGGGDDSSYDPNVVDVLLPSYMNQTEILGNYDESSETYCTIPAVYLGMDNVETVEPTIEITTTNQNYTLPENINTMNISISFSVPADVSIDYFEIFINNTLASTLPANATEYILSFEEGIYNITVKVFDTNGKSASASIIITVNSLKEPEDEPKKGIAGFSILYLTISLVIGIIYLQNKKLKSG
ncbi:MAG: hypothetical protein K9W44_17375 [Candidatus Lokiarchaeota archaeon]|nr:hypothetical protein [Candidatus Harpocratesius repetitus]